MQTPSLYVCKSKLHTNNTLTYTEALDVVMQKIHTNQ